MINGGTLLVSEGIRGLLVVLVLAPGSFSPAAKVFPSLGIYYTIYLQIRYMVEKEPDSGSAVTKSLLTFYTQLLN